MHTHVRTKCTQKLVRVYVNVKVHPSLYTFCLLTFRFPFPPPVSSVPIPCFHCLCNLSRPFIHPSLSNSTPHFFNPSQHPSYQTRWPTISFSVNGLTFEQLLVQWTAVTKWESSFGNGLMGVALGGRVQKWKGGRLMV